MASVILTPASGSTIATVTLGQPMSTLLIPSGGLPPYEFWECDVLDPGYTGLETCLPDGLSLNLHTGLITGTPTMPGTHTFKISVVENYGDVYVATYTVVVLAATPPILTSVTPNAGSTTGGTSVTLTGTDLTGASAVKFGGISAASYTVNNATTITATTPAHAAGLVDVSVTTSNGSGTLTNGYTYMPALPSVAAVNATVAANSSSNPITLNLSGGAADSVAVASAASHGTATASETSITYTPTAGYSGSDSFTYTATNASGTSVPATVNITVTAPVLNLSPSSISNGTIGAAYSTTLSTNGGSAPYSYSLTAGALPTGISLNTTSGVLSGTPTVSGTYNFTITATDSNGATGSQAYSLVIIGLPPIASPTSTTVAANSSSNPVTLNLSGGAATSVAITSAASHGTATASGTSITYTPTAGYSGSDSFAYTATNASGTSAPATVSITVTAPALSLSPSAIINGSTGSAYSTTLSTNGGSAPYSYSLTAGALPTGISLNTASGVLSGTPTVSGMYNFTITATDSNGATGSQAYSLVIIGLPPIAGPTSTTVAANSSSNPVTLNLSGDTATSVDIASAASHGTATASGTSITYTPTAGYSGSDSFAYTATNASGTSALATVSITVTAPALSLSPSAIINGSTGSAYSTTLSTNGGSAPYSYSLTAGALPTGISLNTASGVLSGTTTISGTYNFTITATDSNGATGSQAYSLVIIGLPPITGPTSTTVAANSSSNPITLNLSGDTATSVDIASAASHGTATASGTSITYTPTAGYSGSDSFAYTATNASGTSALATVSITINAPTLVVIPTTSSLKEATVNSAYDVTIEASGGAAPYRYVINSGKLPAGLTLNATTGVLSGTTTEDGTFNFTVAVTDANGATASVNYTLASTAIPVAVVSSSQVIQIGALGIADLTAGASGGPFTGAQLLSVSPADAGIATIVRETSSTPLSALQPRANTVTPTRYMVHFTPAPAFAGTAIVAFALNNASGASGRGNVSFIVQPRPDPSQDPEVISLINAQARTTERFADSQMNNVSRRLERIHQGNTCFSLTQDLKVSSAEQTLPLNQLAQALDDKPTNCDDSPFGVWTGGFVDFGAQRPPRGHNYDFTSSGLSIGSDYRFSNEFTAGLGLGYGTDRSSIGNNGSRSDGESLSTALYASFRPLPQVFVDGVIGYGWLQFDSQRYITADPSQKLASGSRDGRQVFGSIIGAYEMHKDNLMLSPYGRFSLTDSRLDAFQENGGGIYALKYDTQTQRSTTFFFGLRGSYDVPVNWGLITPNLRVEWGHNFSNSGAANLGYADIGTLPYRLTTDTQNNDFMNVEIGTDISLGTWWLDLGYRTTLGQPGTDQSVRLDLGTKF